DQDALVVPPSGKAFLQKTPIDPPFPSSNSITSTATLAADGTLTGHFDVLMEADLALDLRAGFRQLAPAQWQTLVQQISYAFGFAGDVSGVEVENLENVDKPFHYSYDYNRKNYSDWAEHKITFPLPPLSFGPGPDAEKPKEPFWSGDPGDFSYRASIRLPSDFAPDLPSDVSLTTDFAGYSSHYSLKDGTFACERKLTIKRSKVALEQWAAYQKFIASVQSDQTTFISLSEPTAEAGNAKTAPGQPLPTEKNSAKASDLVNRAIAALQARNLSEGRDLLAQAQQLNPKEPKLWLLYANVAFLSGQMDEALADARKEIQLHPDEPWAYGQLALFLTKTGKRDEAIDTCRKALQLWPQNEEIAGSLVTLLLQSKRYSEIAPALEKSIAAAPENYRLRVLRVQGLLGTADHAQALAEAQEIAKATTEPLILNNLAYYLADSGVTTPSAVEWAQQAISQTEQGCAHVTLAGLQQKDIGTVNLLSAEWDTLGWVYFKQGDLAAARRYMDAAWRLSQDATKADHLGQLYQKQGKPGQAIHMWRLALAEQPQDETAKQLLQKAGAPVIPPVTHPGPSKQPAVSPAEELSLMRTVKLPGLPNDTPLADYFVLVSRQGVQDVQIAAQAEATKPVKEALQNAKFDLVFPDDGPEEIVRRGILSCSAYTNPNCQFTMLPLSATSVVGLLNSSLEAKEPRHP
ncbi:MAG: tetratricopeptide repeat protein, partial [Acidobacteriaceae bacterium]|nr:tetratricopeptide repeat protein [Acidobacteriaceae bacterium]